MGTCCTSDRIVPRLLAVLSLEYVKTYIRFPQTLRVFFGGRCSTTVYFYLHAIDPSCDGYRGR